jgi:hypothetical protein
VKRIRPLNRGQCDSVVALVGLGKARIVKEFRDGKATFFAVSVSGAPIGTPHKNFAYLFEAQLISAGNGDGLFPGCDQTAGARR